VSARDHRGSARAGDRLHRFHGGLRLRHNKKVSCRDPVVRPPLPRELVVPLLQHRGRPAAPCVRPGETVLKGQLIGVAPGRGAHVHAPTSGLVTTVEDRPMAHFTGQSGPCTVIRVDGEERWGERRSLPDWRDAAPADLRRHIRQAGIVGLGGAVFPTDLKVGARNATPIHTLVLNGAECEPYISCDEMLMREHPRRIVEGAMMLRHAVGAERVIIGIEDQMGVVEAALARATAAVGGAEVEVVRIPTVYPEGGERQLVQTLTGQEVPEGGYPHDLGLLVQNVATAASVREAVVEGTPLIERYVTVTGNGVRHPRNFCALIGTPAAHLVEAAGGYTPDVTRLVVGGPMMGYPLAHDGEPVVKATNCLLALKAADVRPTQPEMPCIRCGDCARVCPAQLMPQELHVLARAEQWDTARALGVEACIECGCCDYVCPSHIPLANWFRYAKGQVQARDLEQAAADRARRRFEAREARLEQARREKAERMARRKRQLKDKAERKRQVAAALARAAQGDRKPDGDGDP